MLDVAIDGPGGDNGLDISIPGTVKALRENSDIQVTIFGNKLKIEVILSKINIEEDIRKKIKICNIEDKYNVPMYVKDPHLVRSQYPESSMISALNYVKNGESNALISAGNTGALCFGSFRILKPIEGISGIALAGRFPDKNGKEDTLVLDIGANNEPSVKNILQNAIMGALYIKNTKGKEKPRVGLLNMGKESNKGRKIEKEAFKLLSNYYDLFEFVGNIEGNESLNNKIDIIVTDGFTGNNVLKMGEGTKEAMIYMIKSKLDEKAKKLRIPQIIRSRILNMIDKLFISTDGGAILLGINKPVVKAHGGTSIEAFANAIQIVYEYTKGNIIEDIKNKIAKMKPKEEI